MNNNSTIILSKIGITLVSCVGAAVAGKIAGNLVLKNNSISEGLFDNIDINNMSKEEFDKEMENIYRQIDERADKIKFKIALATILSMSVTGAVLGGTGMYILSEHCKCSSDSNSFTIGNNYMI